MVRFEMCDESRADAIEMRGNAQMRQVRVSPTGHDVP